jgi:hypothetical protein
MALPEPLERNGFRVTRKVFTSPQNAASLDSDFETNRPNDISACAVALSVAASVEKWRMLWK